MSVDLIGFIPGIGATASFTPGGTTPAPFNVAFIGGTDGTGPSTATNNMAEIYNRLLLQIYSVIITAGLTYDHNNWTQLSDAITALITSATYVTISQYNSDFAHSSFATNGWQDIAGGRIEQEVDLFVAGAANTLVTVTYPIAFPTASKMPLISWGDPNADTGNSSNFLGIMVKSWNRFGCTFTLGQNGGGARDGTVHVEAVGW